MSSQFLLDPTNLLALPAAILGNFRYGNYKGAYEQSGVPGVALELTQSALGVNTQPFFISTDSEWQIQDIQALLMRYGIKLWGVAYWNGQLHFSVKKRQAHWAQYVMLRAGVPLMHGLLPGSRAIPGAGKAQTMSEDADESALSWLKDLFK